MSRRILIIHLFFDALGGAELLTLNIARVLKEEGYEPYILTATPVDQAEIYRRFGISTEDFNFLDAKRYSGVLEIRRALKSKFSRLRRIRAYEKLFKKHLREWKDYYDIIIETQSNILTPVDINYIHDPTVIPNYLKGVTHGGLHRKMYNFIVRNYFKRYLKKSKPRKLLTNSSWSANLLQVYTGLKPSIVYPPVDVEYYSTVADNDDRENLIVTISRLTPEKNLDTIADVANLLKNYDFVIFGSTQNDSEKVIELLNKKIEKYKLNNLKIILNAPKPKRLEYLKIAKYYLHPMFSEAFGIAIVEAMAAGVVSIVYCDGGIWHDIVRLIDNTLCYRAVYQIPNIIKKLDTDNNYYHKVRNRSINISFKFNYKTFKNSFIREIRLLKLSNKSRLVNNNNDTF